MMVKSIGWNKKLVLLSVAFILSAIFVSKVSAQNMVVYYADNDSVYHVDPDCSQKPSAAKETTLDAISGKNLPVCSKCDKSKTKSLPDTVNIKTTTTPTSVPTANSGSQSTYIDPNENQAMPVYYSEGSNIYHKNKDCIFKLADSKSVSLAYARTQGLKPCATCSGGPAISGETSEKLSKLLKDLANSEEKEMQTEEQRRRNYKSKTNPKRGKRPVSPLRPMVNGYMYGDFGTFNSYHSENHLGGTPIYVLGTVTSIAPLGDVGNYYRLGLMVNDADGYQWYMRVYVAHDKYDLFKMHFTNKSAYFYGAYSGYSGVMYRPMLDPTVAIDVLGTSTSMASYY